MSVDFAGPSVGAAGSATAPTANTSVASIASLPKGRYLVQVASELTGTAETGRNNLRLRNGSTELAPLLSAGSTEGVVIDHSGAGSLNVAPIADATAGAVYAVSLRATPVIPSR